MQIYTLYHIVFADGDKMTYSTQANRASEANFFISQGYEPGVDFHYENEITDEETYGSLFYW